jgi:myosin heavy subunit
MKNKTKIENFIKKLTDFLQKIIEIELTKIITNLNNDSLLEKNFFFENNCSNIFTILNQTKKDLNLNNISIPSQIWIFKNIFLFLNNSLFNILTRDNSVYCNLKSGLNLKYSISLLENWCWEKGITLASVGLKLIREASDLLIMNKNELSNFNFLLEFCKTLDISKAERILLLYKKDSYFFIFIFRNDKQDIEIPLKVMNSLKENKKIGFVHFDLKNFKFLELDSNDLFSFNSSFDDSVFNEFQILKFDDFLF